MLPPIGTSGFIDKPLAPFSLVSSLQHRYEASTVDVQTRSKRRAKDVQKTWVNDITLVIPKSTAPEDWSPWEA